MPPRMSSAPVPPSSVSLLAPPIKEVVAAEAAQRVVAVEAVEPVDAVVPGQNVGKRVAAAIHRRSGQRQVSILAPRV